jgi:hypothetical protein
LLHLRGKRSLTIYQSRFSLNASFDEKKKEEEGFDDWLTIIGIVPSFEFLSSLLH